MNYYRQHDEMDCGPTCIRMIAKHYGKNYSIDSLRQMAYMGRGGASLLGISEAAEKIGFKTLAVKADITVLISKAPLPCVLHWNQNHFVVLYKIKKAPFSGKYLFYIADPAVNKVEINQDLFIKSWMAPGGNSGIALLMEPTQQFYLNAGENTPGKLIRFNFLLNYLAPFKPYFLQLMLALLLGTLLELLFPFLTQSLVDNGIGNQNLGFVYIILISQLMLFLGKTFVELLRAWLLLHVTTRINISILSDFIYKLMKLPVSFFDAKLIGDISQRIGDQHRIEQFLTNSSFNTFFSLINLLIFSVIMAYYNVYVLIVFLGGSVLSIVYVLLFMGWRKNLDYARFTQMSDNQNQIFEIISGMPEIKLNNAELPERWNWERIQARIFKLNTSSLALEQWQMTGSRFIDQLKNIIISFLAARAVIEGKMTLGMMMSVSYIIGQMNAPIEQLLVFFRSAQDASISLDRLKEIHDKENEDSHIIGSDLSIAVSDVSVKGSLLMRDVSFKYNPLDQFALFDNLSLEIPEGKITAIVGTSGSGKTTLLKLLLKFYPPQTGDILLGNSKFSEISSQAWRSKCGVVMQDGYIFGKTIAQNIALGAEHIDYEKLRHAAQIGNIQGYVEGLPLKYNTKIGNIGNGLSQGQKQRILIARAVYKNPDYLFFDEATSALDANNESVIMQKLDEFFKGRTVVVVAHRLSTVKNADKIVVLEKGEIIEEGTHTELTAKRGAYYNLVKNQLELGA